MENRQRAINAIGAMRTDKTLNVAKYWIGNSEHKTFEELANATKLSTKSSSNITFYLKKKFDFVFEIKGSKKKRTYKLVDCHFGVRKVIMPKISPLWAIALGLPAANEKSI